MQVIDAILLEVSVETVYLAEEIKTLAPSILEEYSLRFPNVDFQYLPHVPDFDKLVHQCKGVIRTGQYGFHAANCVLKIACDY
jgi:D-ribose pyranase